MPHPCSALPAWCRFPVFIEDAAGAYGGKEWKGWREQHQIRMKHITCPCWNYASSLHNNKPLKRMQTKVETQDFASHKGWMRLLTADCRMCLLPWLDGRRKILRLYRARATAIVKYGKAIMAAVYAPNGSHDMHIPEYTVNSSGSA